MPQARQCWLWLARSASARRRYGGLFGAYHRNLFSRRLEARTKREIHVFAISSPRKRWTTKSLEDGRATRLQRSALAKRRRSAGENRCHTRLLHDTPRFVTGALDRGIAVRPSSRRLKYRFASQINR